MKRGITATCLENPIPLKKHLNRNTVGLVDEEMVNIATAINISV